MLFSPMRCSKINVLAVVILLLLPICYSLASCHSTPSSLCRLLLRSGCHTSMVRYRAGVLPAYHTSFSNDSSMTPI